MHRIIACGIDMIEIARVRQVAERFGARFLERVYSVWEREHATARRDPGPYFAGRFAAKEAVLKVLGCGLFAGVPLSAIEIRAKESGELFCVLAGPARERAAQVGITRIVVSISHCDSYAVAQAIGVEE